jgi:hypothetical protein
MPKKHEYDPSDGWKVGLVKAIFAIANELSRRNSVELIDRIKLAHSGDSEERFIAYEAEEKL